MTQTKAASEFKKAIYTSTPFSQQEINSNLGDSLMRPTKSKLFYKQIHMFQYDESRFRKGGKPKLEKNLMRKTVSVLRHSKKDASPNQVIQEPTSFRENIVDK